MNNADSYAKNKKMQKEDALYLLDNYFRLIKLHPQGIDRILDVGCGDGEVTVEILFDKFPKKNQKIVGCDISENMVNYANKKYQNKKQISFLQLDIATVMLPKELDDSFHHIFSFYCLHWVQDQAQAMKNMYKLLKPGGDMLLVLCSSNPMFAIHKEMEKSEKWRKYVTNVNNYISPYYDRQDPAKELENLLKKTGFSVPFCTIVERTHSFKNMDDLKSNIIPVSPFITKIPENDREDYLNEMIYLTKKMKLIEQNNNDDDSIVIPHRLLVAFAIKAEK